MKYLTILTAAMALMASGLRAEPISAGTKTETEYLKIQTFKLRYEREYTVPAKASEGYLVQLEHGQSLRRKKGIIQGSIEGHLKWISKDPNGYEVDIEFGNSQYTWKDTDDPVPDWLQAERQDCWLKPFAAHVTMNKREEVPLSIEITKTDCPEQYVLVQYEKVLHLLHDLLLSSVDKQMVLQNNYNDSTENAPPVFRLDFPSQVVFKGIGPKPYDLNSGGSYLRPPRELNYHFKIEDFQVTAYILSRLSYQKGGLASFHYEYNAETDTITYANQLVYPSFEDLGSLTPGKVVDEVNTSQPPMFRLCREIRVDDL